MGNFGSTLTSNIASSFGQGIGGIFGSAISAGADLLGQHFQRKHEKEMQERQAKINREAYDHEFETEAAYNNPVAERARMEAAGLNPALMYGQGAGGSSVSASITSQGSGTSSAGSTSIGRPTPAGNPLAGSQLQASMAQVKQSTAQASAYDAQAQKTLSEIADPTPIEEGKPATPGQLAYQSMLLSNDEKKYGNTLRQLDIEIRNATKDVEKAMAFEQLRALRAQILRDDNVAQATIDHFNSLVDLHGEQAKDLRITRSSRVYKNNAEGFRASNQADESNVRYRIMQELSTDDRFHNAILSRMEAQVKNMESSAGLNNENAKYVYAYMILRAIDSGSNVVKVISSEGRGWAQYFLNKSKQDGPMATLMELAGDDMSFDDIKELVSLFANFGK